MACSGINEHKEGCRKQRVLDRAAFARKLLMEGGGAYGVAPPPQALQEDPEAPGYMRKMGSPPGIAGNNASYEAECYSRQGMVDMAGVHNPTAIDRLRRETVRGQQLVEYSAKIPDRFSATNYTQQW